MIYKYNLEHIQSYNRLLRVMQNAGTKYYSRSFNDINKNGTFQLDYILSCADTIFPYDYSTACVKHFIDLYWIKRKTIVEDGEAIEGWRFTCY